MKHLKKYSFIVVLALLASACNSTKIETYNTLEAKKEVADGIDFFQGTFQEAKILANKHSKGFLKFQKERLIFVDAYATWCGPCKKMSANTFTQPSVGEYFDKYFVNLKIDCEKGEGIDLCRKWGVGAYPTLIILDTDGNIVAKQVGYMDGNQLLAWAKEVYKHRKNPSKIGS